MSTRETLPPSPDWHDAPPEASGNPLGKIWIWLAIAGVVGLMLWLVDPRREPPPHPAVGSRLVDLRLSPLTGDSAAIELPDLAGKVVLLNFWGTWCPPCRAEMPDIASLAKHYRDEKDFLLLAVSCSGSGDDRAEDLRPQTESFLNESGYDLATYCDPQGFTQRQAAMVLGDRSFSYPTTLLLDRRGTIQAVCIGYDRGVIDGLRAKIDQLLAQK